MNILIVDDELVSRVKITKLLSAYGTCTAVEDGPAALCAFGFAFGSGKPYDLIAMDVDMPGLRGQDVVKAIRSWETRLGVERPEEFPTRQNVRIVMVTASRDMTVISSSYQQLCDDYLVKPVTPDNIRASLVKLGLA